MGDEANNKFYVGQIVYYFQRNKLNSEIVKTVLGKGQYRLKKSTFFPYEEKQIHATAREALEAAFAASQKSAEYLRRQISWELSTMNRIFELSNGLPLPAPPKDEK